MSIEGYKLAPEHEHALTVLLDTISKFGTQGTPEQTSVRVVLSPEEGRESTQQEKPVKGDVRRHQREFVEEEIALKLKELANLQHLVWKLHTELAAFETRFRVLGASSRVLYASKRTRRRIVWSAERIEREIDCLRTSDDVYAAKWAGPRREETDVYWNELRDALHELGGALYEFADECNVGDTWAQLNAFRRAVRHSTHERWTLAEILSLSNSLQSTMASFRTFNISGIDSIRAVQQASSNSHINLSQTAAFLAGVSATALQYAPADAPDPLSHGAYYAFWYLSLVLGVFSASLNVMAAVVVQYPHRPHLNSLPNSLNIALSSLPMITLAGAGLSLLMGLCIFAFVPALPLSVKIIGSTSSGLAFLVLATFILFFLYRRIDVIDAWNTKSGDVELVKRTPFLFLRPSLGGLRIPHPRLPAQILSCRRLKPIFSSRSRSSGRNDGNRVERGYSSDGGSSPPRKVVVQVDDTEKLPALHGIQVRRPRANSEVSFTSEIPRNRTASDFIEPPRTPERQTFDGGSALQPDTPISPGNGFLVPPDTSWPPPKGRNAQIPGPVRIEMADDVL